jgi:hypothetical protein
MVKDLEETLDNVSRVISTIEKGDGTLGKLLKDPKAYDDLVKILGQHRAQQHDQAAGPLRRRAGRGRQLGRRDRQGQGQLSR